MELFETVYLGRTNTLRRTIIVNGSPLNFITMKVSRATLQLGELILDSSEEPDVIDITKEAQEGNVLMRLGKTLKEIPSGAYKGKLILYGDNFPNGLDGLGSVFIRVVGKSNG